MKKVIIITGVLVALCVTSLCAQTKEQKAGFSSKFSDASNASWEKVTADISLVRFAQANAISLAYFNHRGDLLVSGKQIELGQAPESVQKSLSSLVKSQEKQEGALRVIQVYELKQETITKFYANLGNENVQLAVMVTFGGRATVLKRNRIDANKMQGPVIAGF